MRYFLAVSLFFCLPIFSFAQIITYSQPIKGDTKDINFEIIGKVNGNLLVFKNIKSDYEITVYDNNMQLKETAELDFLPAKTFNVDCIAYQNFVYLIYQYQKKGTIICGAAKVDADAKIIGQPVDLDTTASRENNIYTTIASEDKQKIMIFKTIKDRDQITIATLLLDDNLQIIKKARQAFPYADDRTVFNNFLLSNDGEFNFTISAKAAGKDYFNELRVVTKAALADSFVVTNVDLKNRFTDQVFAKVDNVNKHYILNSFFYTEKRGNAQGICATIFDVKNDSVLSNLFIAFGDSVRMAVKNEGNKKYALNDLVIKNVIVKKDGGYILIAEDYYVQQSNGNGFNQYNRWNYLYNSMYMSPFGYNPYYYNPYNPYGFNNPQTNVYYYKNIFVVSIDKNGNPEWNNVVYKDQFDYNENELSFATFTTGGEIHIMYNELVKRKQVLSDKGITASGGISDNAAISGINKDYDFLPRFGKQVGSKQFIIPCIYRNQICFAKIEY
jgi:hypothetical protein